MPATATTLIQRTRRFIGDWPDLDASTASIASNATTLTVADTSIYGQNWIIQLDQELMRVKALASGTNLTVARGVQGTAAASHVSATSVLVRPAFSDQQILDSLNAGIDATFPYYYQSITDTSLTADGSTYEFAVPNMTLPNIPIPYLSRIEIKETADLAWRQVDRWDVRRSASPIIKFRSMLPPCAIRIHGFGPFNQLGFTDTLSALWPAWGDDVLVEYAANRLLMSGEAARVRQDTGAKDERESANRVGSSASAAGQLLQRFQMRMQQQPMPPMPKHVVRTV